MEVKYKKEVYTLGKRDRKLESEAPAVRVKMIDEQTKVIGMMAPKVQVMITLPCIKSYNNGLHNIINEYASKTIVYIITKSSDDNLTKVKSAYSLDDGFISNDFKDFSLKFGINMSEELFAKSIFVIDKEGIIKYKQIPSNIDKSFDLEEFKEKLSQTVNFKQKGHIHENWMGV
ncbi:redoxin family protein [Arcobacter sp. LA11]|uniref:redoxin family protein n=1 Tax=Arcobacter sp. LA11 TaxID=1898176 RepID=UPI0009331769|nr:redoxin family protein [Arcobacter sp. LA11]